MFDLLTVFGAISGVLEGPNILLVAAGLFALAGAAVFVTIETPIDKDEIAAVGLHDAMLQLSARKRLVNPGLQRLSGLARKFNPAERTVLLERRIAMAGMSSTWPIDRAMFTKLVLGLVGLLAGIAVFFVVTGPVRFFLGPVIALSGWNALDFYLDKKATSRQQEIEYALPDVLDQLTIVVEAGLGFEQAFQRITISNDNPLVDEFATVLRQMRLGMARRPAMNSLLDRTDVVQLRMFVRALNQADRSGIPMGHILRVQADEAREKRRQRAEEKAMQLPVKLLFPLVVFILPALFIAILGPAALRIQGNGGVTGGGSQDNVELRQETVVGQADPLAE
jgi:tight adherence protein C